MECLIHVGMHKTATTSFQYFLANNSSRLRKLGCLYPKSFRANNQHSLLPGCYFPNHQFLPRERSLDPMVYINQFKKELASGAYSYCVLSSEVFNELMIKDASQFNILLKEITSMFNDYKLLLTTRELNSAAFSGIKHRLRHMHKKPECKLIPNLDIINTFKNIRTTRERNLANWRRSNLPIVEKAMEETSNPTQNYFSVICDFFKDNEVYQTIKEIGLNSINFKENKDEFLPYIYLILILSSIIIKNNSYEKINLSLITIDSLLTFIQNSNINNVKLISNIKDDINLSFLENYSEINFSSSNIENHLRMAGLSNEDSSNIINISYEYIMQLEG